MYICNIMTQPGETGGYTAFDHVNAILEHTCRDLIDVVVANNSDIPFQMKMKYKEEGARPVVVDSENILRNGLSVIQGDVISTQDYVRHDPEKLLKMISEYCGWKLTGNSPLTIKKEKVRK